MRRISRDSWLALGILVALVLVTVAAAIQQARQQEGKNAPPLLSSSTAPDGARALWLWLDEIGYRTSDHVGGTFRIPEEIDLVLMLEPFSGITDDEWKMLDEWVADGGTLLLAGDGWGTLFAARHYDFDLTYLGEQVPTLTLQAPLWVSPPLTGTVSAQTSAYWATERDDFVPHLAVASGPVMVSFAYGTGRVVLSAAPFPFSNAGLKEAGNPALVLNAISAAGGAGVWFDEWHHGIRGDLEERAGPADWLRHVPAGQALLYGAGVIFVALVLRGRHFGRPVPLPQHVARRAPLEYITAIANLHRRAGHRAAVMAQYRHRLKRGLGRRYRLSPALPDDEYVDRLGDLDPDLDVDALRSLLARLRRAGVEEREMLQLAVEVATWSKETL